MAAQKQAYVIIEKKKGKPMNDPDRDISIDFIGNKISVSSDVKITFQHNSYKKGKKVCIKFRNGWEKKKKIHDKLYEFWFFFDCCKDNVMLFFKNVKCNINMSYKGLNNEETSSSVTIPVSFSAEESSLLDVIIPKLNKDDLGYPLQQKWLWFEAMEDSHINVKNYVENVNFQLCVDNSKDASTINIMNCNPSYVPTYHTVYIPSHLVDVESVKRITYNDGLCQCELQKHCLRGNAKQIGKLQPTEHNRAFCWRKKFNHPCDKWLGEKSKPIIDIESYSSESECDSFSDEEEIEEIEEQKPSSSNIHEYNIKEVNNCGFCGKLYTYDQCAYDCHCDFSPMCLKCSQIISRYCEKRDINFKCVECDGNITQAKISFKQNKRQRND